MPESTTPTERLELDEPLVLSVKGAAEALEVSEKTVRRLIARGELRARRVGGQVRILRTELERYLGA